MPEDNDRIFPFAPGPLPDPARSALPAWLLPSPGEACHVLSRRQKPAAELTGGEVIPLMQRRALDLLNAGWFAEAQALFEQLLGVDPAEVSWLLLKGACLVERRKYRAALAVLNTAERLSPHDPDVLLLKADVFQELKAYGKAAQVLTRLLADDPDNSPARYRLACCAALNGKPHQALNALRRVVAEESGFGEEAALDPAFAGLRWMAGFEILLQGHRRA